ncbi:S-adenosylmethionine decarboxylase [Lipingzhangella halophila]|uniref:S-adenosylmethionine decarboxylase n=1 Tax=Lipingzhangella halophila TaxID=1783352 RepID=A0A7W7W6G9_9ACTN|nr:S-adenosylmethionine decarboxylase [Lipingzhangella halophila]MBB4934845.1 S-adenosylmethionine decarboxylase [Lipingzhangella halophila]
MICLAVDLLDCTHPDPAPDQLGHAMHTTAHLLGVHVLHDAPVQFPTHGTTRMMVLAESHLVVSTWPEYHLAQIDLVTCRANTPPEEALTPLTHLFGATETRHHHIRRAEPRAKALREGSHGRLGTAAVKRGRQR